MNVVDSSAWLEYLTNGPNAENFAPAIEDISKLGRPFHLSAGSLQESAS